MIDTTLLLSLVVSRSVFISSSSRPSGCFLGVVSFLLVLGTGAPTWVSIFVVEEVAVLE